MSAMPDQTDSRPTAEPLAPSGSTNGAPVGAGRNLLFLREEELRLAQDLLFFGYRDFTAGADAILAELEMGRAHHRVLHFVGRRPGITVGDLLGILAITKQSLGRVLTPLIEDGYVQQSAGRNDRRQRLLSLTPKGEALERRLFERQREWVMRAYREAGPVAVEGFRRVMRGLMGADARAQLERLEQPADRPGHRPTPPASPPARPSSGPSLSHPGTSHSTRNG
jgi:DNA-binding MarR family transcriptional regulator